MLLAAAALTACHRRRPDTTIAGAKRGPVAAAPAHSDPRIVCATRGQAFADACTFSRQDTPAGLVVTIQRADGGFRRLLVTRDGRGVVAADGAQAARVSVAGPDVIEVALGDDRYRLPATIRAGAR